MDKIEKLARAHGTGGWQTLDDMVRFGRAVAATEREAHDYTKGKLAGALDALRQLQECVPPKDWKRYASEVLALDARDRERSNAKSQATDAALSRQVACTDGLGVAVPPAPTFGEQT